MITEVGLPLVDPLPLTVDIRISSILTQCLSFRQAGAILDGACVPLIQASSAFGVPGYGFVPNPFASFKQLPFTFISLSSLRSFVSQQSVLRRRR